MEKSRNEKIENMLRALANEYLNRESNKTSLITITHVELTPDMKNATIFFTVLPEDKENAAVGFMLRQRKNIRNHIKKNSQFRVLPFIETKLDIGEKNRQLIETLSKKIQ
jgi:ribosome-binding factor A